jgi:biopolymer transport protein TolR
MNFKINKKRKRLYDINVTPFVDVVLVLLIIFMVTSPLLNSVDVNLPKTSSQLLELKNKPLMLAVNKEGEMFVDEKKIKTLLELEKNLQKYDFKKTQIIIKGDREVNYEKVVDIISLVAKNGFTNVSLLTEK